MTYIALLRAVNVGGHNLLNMDRLRAVVTRLGFTDVQSILQSGNVVFHGENLSTLQIGTMLEDALRTQAGLQTDLFVYTPSQWNALVEGNPFPAEAKQDPAHMVVMFLKTIPDRAFVSQLRSQISGSEMIRAKGNLVCIVYPRTIGPSRLTSSLIEKMFQTRATGRNWNTILKLSRLAGV